MLPFVAVALGAKVAVNVAGWDTGTLTPLHSGLVAANVFLVGFLLAGTLSDYKESEKLPGELAGRAESIADECEILYHDTRAQPALQCLEHLHAFARELNDWLHGRSAVRVPLERLDGLNHFFLAFQPLTQPNFIVRIKQEQAALRLLVIRIDTIRETSFVGAGYRIAEITSLLLVIALSFTDFAGLGAELFLLGSIAFLLAYMIMLIRDMDDPFDYGADGKLGSVEVSLAPIDRLEHRLEFEISRLRDDAT